MDATPTTLSRTITLATYRIWRRTGLAPMPAMVRSADRAAANVCEALADGRTHTAEFALSEWQTATDYADEIEARMQHRPFWQTGKVTFMPASMTREIDTHGCHACHGTGLRQDRAEVTPCNDRCDWPFAAGPLACAIHACYTCAGFGVCPHADREVMTAQDAAQFTPRVGTEWVCDVTGEILTRGSFTDGYALQRVMRLDGLNRLHVMDAGGNEMTFCLVDQVTGRAVTHIAGAVAS